MKPNHLLEPPSNWPLVEVRWWDIQATAGWVPRADAPSQLPSPAITVGFLAYEDDFKVVVVYNLDDTNFQGDILPKGCIHSIRPVRLPTDDHLLDHAD